MCICKVRVVHTYFHPFMCPILEDYNIYMCALVWSCNDDCTNKNVLKGEGRSAYHKHFECYGSLLNPNKLSNVSFENNNYALSTMMYKSRDYKDI